MYFVCVKVELNKEVDYENFVLSLGVCMVW